MATVKDEEDITGMREKDFTGGSAVFCVGIRLCGNS